MSITFETTTFSDLYKLPEHQAVIISCCLVLRAPTPPHLTRSQAVFMTRSRSLSRSTTVVAAGSGDHKRKGKRTGQKRRSRDAPPPVVTWDHDNSDPEELDAPTATPSTLAAGKKRPRDGTDKKPSVIRRDNDKGAKSLKRQRPGETATRNGDQEEDEEASGVEGASDSEEEVDLADDKHRAGVEAPAAGTGGMGDVMAKILGQKLETTTQVGAILVSALCSGSMNLLQARTRIALLILLFPLHFSMTAGMTR